jgi:hypothetical protein
VVKDGLDRVRSPNGVVLRFVGLHKSGQYIKAFTLRGIRSRVEEAFDFL